MNSNAEISKAEIKSMNEPSIKNRGGAPAGNANAVKHGFYSRTFRQAESKDLDGDMLGELQDEIALMRVLILRAAEFVKDNPQLSLAENLITLRGVTQAVTCLMAIYRTQKVVFKNGMTPMQEALELLRAIPVEED